MHNPLRFTNPIGLAGLALVGLMGCQGGPSDAPPIVPIRNMYQQPRYNAQAKSRFFRDGRTMRPLVQGVVAQEMSPDPTAASGWSDDGQTWALAIPEHVVGAAGGPKAMLERGRERYDIFCTPCHGYTGEGDGAVPTRVGGPIRPPTLHDDRVRHMPDGQLFATISRGVRNMPAYKHSMSNDDRWAVVAYVRALQMSQAPAVQAMNTVTP